MVNKGTNSKGEEVAIKCYNENTEDEGLDVGVLRELVYLKSLPPHENIIKLDEIEW